MDMIEKNIKRLISILTSNNFLKDLYSYDSLFYDEPKFYAYAAILNDKLNVLIKSGYSSNTKNISSSGVSYSSRAFALMKCISEIIERASLFSYTNSQVIYGSYNQFKKKGNILNPSIYRHFKHIQDLAFGWIKGTNLYNNTDCYIPAQLVFLNYSLIQNEVQLSPFISTGAAGGFSIKEALTHGLYEIVERDAVMTMYLNKIPIPKINLSLVKSSKLKNILMTFKKYNLELYVFDAKNDINIPVYIAIIIDRSGVKPWVSVGAKAGFLEIDTIIGCIEEAFSERMWIRYAYMREGSNNPRFDFSNIDIKLRRGLFWSNKNMVKKLDFLLKQDYKQKVIYNKISNKSNEFTKLVDTIKRNKFNIYYVNLTLPFFKDVGHEVIKAIIPGMQPLYLTSKEHPLRFGFERLKSTAYFFGQNQFNINKIPHPFV
jgi:thiazole/oxazole-forming peptide maturase SagD family component